MPRHGVSPLHLRFLHVRFLHPGRHVRRLAPVVLAILLLLLVVASFLFVPPAEGTGGLASDEAPHHEYTLMESSMGSPPAI